MVFNICIQPVHFHRLDFVFSPKNRFSTQKPPINVSSMTRVIVHSPTRVLSCSSSLSHASPGIREGARMIIFFMFQFAFLVDDTDKNGRSLCHICIVSRFFFRCGRCGRCRFKKIFDHIVIVLRLDLTR